jgi:hypothetical protein
MSFVTYVRKPLKEIATLPFQGQGVLVMVEDLPGNPLCDWAGTSYTVPLTSAQAAAVAIVDLTAGDSSAATVTANMALLQAALDRKGRVRINKPGTYYWRAPADQTYVKGTSSRQPSVLTIGSDTHLEIAEGVNFFPAPGTTYSAFISNKSFILNKAIVGSWSVGALIETEYKLVTFTLSSGTLAIDVNDWVIVRGDTAYGWDNGYRVEAVDVPNAATQFTLRVWKTELDGISINANDTIIAYKADGNFSVNVYGRVSGSVPGSITNANPGQGERATFMFNKVVDAELTLRDYSGGGFGKMACFWNAYRPRCPVISKKMVGAGVCFFGPTRDIKIGTLYDEGGEDAIILQNVSNNAGVSNGAQDSDGTMASGDIVGCEVDHFFGERASPRGVGIFATGDLNDTKLVRRIDGIRFNNMHIRNAAGGAIFHVCTDNITTAAGLAGGNVGLISIGNLYYEDNGSAATPPDALFKHYTSTTPSSGLRWEGVCVDNFNIKPSKVGPALGLRAFLASLGGNATGSTPLTIGQITVKNANWTLDSLNMAGAPRLININNNTTLDDFQILGGKIQGLLTYQNLVLVSGGTGYAIGDIVQPATGTVWDRPMRIKVLTVSSGAILTFAIIEPGSYKGNNGLTSGTVGTSFVTGAGSGFTFTYTSTSFGWSFFLHSVTNSLIKRCHLADLDVAFSYNGAARNASIGRGASSGGTTMLRMTRCTLDLYSIFGSTVASANMDLQMTDCDLQNTTFNLSQGACFNTTTWNLWLKGNRFQAAQSLITPNASQVTTGCAINVRTSGDNTGTSGNNSVVRPIGGNTGITLNLIGSCLDLYADLAPSSTDLQIAVAANSLIQQTNANTTVFNVSAVTTDPTPGATFTNNAITYTVVSAQLTGTAGSRVGTVVCSGSGAPLASGTLTKVTGTGDATVTFGSAVRGAGLYARGPSNMALLAA